MLSPETPQHTAADEELNIDNINELDESDIQGLDLEDERESTASTTYTQPAVKRERVDENFEERFDLQDDFMPRVNISSPFSSDVDVKKYAQRAHYASQQRKLSLSQQSKFISYCDDKLLAIQRKFVQSRGLNEENGYQGLGPLLEDLKTVLDFVWFSIEGLTNTELLLKMGLNAMTQDQFAGTQQTSFGQVNYLIRVADDFLDYLTKFELNKMSSDEQHKTVSKAFKFMIILDVSFARLLEGLVPGNTKLSGTEMVRIAGIAERTRTAVPRYLSEQQIHGYHYEVSKIYEETLERCA
ncbi:LAME_0B01222g1_1 [Lachancea meyersii CBS 8951]|uniref:LAME_0B01222g1_1 n=1 Tax=Lachancea meyersii CBS 8951 TaxID=1266667 RepID=A0A1G4ITH2_9SACH|nr:LAME_0B01222g1_1 [Lachancea meyersii CBS 8951]